MNDETDQANQEFVTPEEALSRSQKAIRALEILLFHDREKLAALKEQIVGMKMADAAMQARLRYESEARTREFEVLTRQLEEASARAEHAEFEAAEARRTIESIHGSTTWRVMTVLAAHPWLRRILKSGVTTARRGLRAARSRR